MVSYTVNIITNFKIILLWAMYYILLGCVLQ